MKLLFSIIFFSFLINVGAQDWKLQNEFDYTSDKKYHILTHGEDTIYKIEDTADTYFHFSVNLKSEYNLGYTINLSGTNYDGYTWFSDSHETLHQINDKGNLCDLEKEGFIFSLNNIVYKKSYDIKNQEAPYKIARVTGEYNTTNYFEDYYFPNLDIFIFRIQHAGEKRYYLSKSTPDLFQPDGDGYKELFSTDYIIYAEDFKGNKFVGEQINSLKKINSKDSVEFPFFSSKNYKIGQDIYDTKHKPIFTQVDSIQYGTIPISFYSELNVIFIYQQNAIVSVVDNDSIGNLVIKFNCNSFSPLRWKGDDILLIQKDKKYGIYKSDSLYELSNKEIKYDTVLFNSDFIFAHNNSELIDIYNVKGKLLVQVKRNEINGDRFLMHLKQFPFYRNGYLELINENKISDFKILKNKAESLNLNYKDLYAVKCNNGMSLIISNNKAIYLGFLDSLKAPQEISDYNSKNEGVIIFKNNKMAWLNNTNYKNNHSPIFYDKIVMVGNLGFGCDGEYKILLNHKTPMKIKFDQFIDYNELMGYESNYVFIDDDKWKMYDYNLNLIHEAKGYFPLLDFYKKWDGNYEYHQGYVYCKDGNVDLIKKKEIPYVYSTIPSKVNFDENNQALDSLDKDGNKFYSVYITNHYYNFQGFKFGVINTKGEELFDANEIHLVHLDSNHLDTELNFNTIVPLTNTKLVQHLVSSQVYIYKNNDKWYYQNFRQLNSKFEGFDNFEILYLDSLPILELKFKNNSKFITQDYDILPIEEISGTFQTRDLFVINTKLKSNLKRNLKWKLINEDSVSYVHFKNDGKPIFTLYSKDAKKIIDDNLVEAFYYDPYLNGDFNFHSAKDSQNYIELSGFDEVIAIYKKGTIWYKCTYDRYKKDFIIEQIDEPIIK